MRFDRPSRVDKLPQMGSVSKPVKAQKAGNYRSAVRGGPPGETGGTVYPTVLEAYNRNSDYKRWHAGLDYWQSAGKNWADLEQNFLVRTLRDFGTLPGPQLTTVTYFPGKSSPDASWTVVNRVRGALILPQLLRAEDMVLDTSAREEEGHRLILDVSATLTSVQLREWQSLIGDQFEDSAISTQFPQGLIEEPIDTVAYTLVGVDADQGKLLFDLSRPYMRRRPNPRREMAFWQRILYNRRLPLSFRNNGSRYLCSSHRFYCSCPDYSGAKIADFSGGTTSSQALFPRPSAGRSIDGRWESQAVGYSSTFRTLAERADQRRECKHIHAVRWSLGYQYYEPSDYQYNGAEDRAFQGISAGDPLTSKEIFQYHQRRELTLDRLGQALAASSRIIIDARDTIPADEEVPTGERPPILWTSTREPAPERVRKDDWWLPRGTSVLRVFDPAAQRFVEEITVVGQKKKFLEEVPPRPSVPQE